MTPRNVYDRVSELCDQLPTDTWNWLEPVLVQMAHEIVLDAAAVCDERANVNNRQMVARCAASLCAVTIRQELLCRDGEMLCAGCTGKGCAACSGRGVVTVGERSHE